MTDFPSTVAPSQQLAAPACRNCGATASGSYCPNCGQETRLALPTVRALLREAAGRYVALDGRMWRTLIGLLFRPGFLTTEYFAGRRRRYIRPARLFLVLSIVLFALLRFAGGPPPFLIDQDLTQAERDKVTREDAGAGHTRLSELRTDVGAGAWLDPLWRRAELFNQLPRREQVDQILAGMLRYGPYAMFALLPLFALLMKLVYVGRARRYPTRPRHYTAHLVFSAHSHAFLFLLVALIVLLTVIHLRRAFIGWAIVYLFLSIRTVYGGRWSGVLARASVIFVVYAVFFALVVACLSVAAILLR